MDNSGKKREAGNWESTQGSGIIDSLIWVNGPSVLTTVVLSGNKHVYTSVDVIYFSIEILKERNKQG